jgi:hypothetical protein
MPDGIRDPGSWIRGFVDGELLKTRCSAYTRLEVVPCDEGLPWRQRNDVPSRRGVLET